MNLATMVMYVISGVGLTHAVSRCQYPLGMENGTISKDQLSSSSFYTSGMSEDKKVYNSDQARLNGDLAWVPAFADSMPYIQVNFSQLVNVTGIATQGYVFTSPSGTNVGSPYFANTFRVMFLVEGESWQNITDSEERQIFTGNVDGNAAHQQNFYTTVAFKNIRIYPEMCETRGSGGCALRFELYGSRACEEQPPLSTVYPAVTSGVPTTKNHTTLSVVQSTTTLTKEHVTYITDTSTMSNDRYTTIASTTYAATPLPSTSSGAGNTLPRAIIAGSTAAVIIVILLVVCLAILIWRQRSRKPRTVNTQVLQYEGTYELTVGGVDSPKLYENTQDAMISNGNADQDNNHVYNDIRGDDHRPYDLPPDAKSRTYESRLSDGIYSQNVTSFHEYGTEENALREHRRGERNEVKSQLYAKVEKKGPTERVKKDTGQGLLGDDTTDMYAEVKKKTPKTGENVTHPGQEGWVENSIYSTGTGS